MRANRAYELLVRKGGRGPALLAGPGRLDHVEIVEIASGEVALLWDTPAVQTGKLSRALREDLARLEDDQFIARWRHWQPMERMPGVS